MILKIKPRGDGRYGVTPFDMETGETLGAIFGTKIFDSFDFALGYAEEQMATIVKLGDEAAIEIAW